MSGIHDQLASVVGDFAIQKIRASDSVWKQIFLPTVHRIGDWGWPRPDYVCFDSRVSYAFEFKPPQQSKREYLTGLGQSLAYLKKHNYAALVLPRMADDGFLIADFVREVLSLPIFCDVPISVIDYDENLIASDPERSIRLVTPITADRKDRIVPTTESSTYWCWWRDMSNYEVYDLLQLAYKYRAETGDIYTNKIWPEFSDRLARNQTRKWDGKFRVKSMTSSSLKSEKQNYKIPLFQLGLISQGSGRITNLGIRLMFTGDLYGSASQPFMDFLAQLLLQEGRYLEWLMDLDRFQKLNRGSIGTDATSFYVAFEEYLEGKGSIGPRKPTAKTTGAKTSYIRDEPKICNKLGLIENTGKNYFVPNVGIDINWERITDLLKRDFTI